MAKTLKDANRRILDLHQRANAAINKGNPEYGVDLLLEVLVLEPELHEVRERLRELQTDAIRSKKINHGMSSLKGMKLMMAVKSAIKKDPEKALPAAEELLKIDPTHVPFLDAYVEAAKAVDLPEIGAIAMKAAAKVENNNEALLEKAGAICQEIGDSDGAVAAYQRLGELRPGDQNVIKLIKDASAVDTMKKGNWEQEGSFRQKLKDEDEANALEQEGRAQHAEDDLGELVATQRNRLAHEPENINLYRHLADNLVKMGEYDEALDALDKANEITKGGDPLILNSISTVTGTIFEHNIKVLRDEGDETGAQEQEAEYKAFRMQDTKDKVERYPNDLSYKFDYGQLLYEDGRIDEAIANFQLSQRNPQKRIDSLFHLGACFKTKGLYDLAASQLKLAAEELPVMDDLKKSVLYELGEVHELQGKTAEALEFFKQIFSIDIGYRDVAQRVEQGYTE